MQFRFTKVWELGQRQAGCDKNTELAAAKAARTGTTGYVLVNTLFSEMIMDQLPPLGDAPLKQAEPIEAVVPGFTAAAGRAGFKNNGRDDLALIAADEPVNAAGVFTKNPLTAAPVVVSRENVVSGMARAILANSGCANAATGEEGLAACRLSCRQAAEVLGCDPEEILPCSTGVIGKVLDTEKTGKALSGMGSGLKPDGLLAAANAIRTTDAFTKTARRDLVLNGNPVRVVGMAKGAGMIRPDMATMLCFVLTDAKASSASLAEILPRAVDLSFNRCTVDGDTSTNDTVLLLASGRAGNRELQPGSIGLEQLEEAVTGVCQDLAAMIVADGEGAGHLVRVRITGAESKEAAEYLCYGISHSLLCKTAMAGKDPNWGRFLSAAAAESSRRGLAFDPQKTELYFGEYLVAKAASWCGQKAEDGATKVMHQNRYEIRLELGQGLESHWVLTTDLDHEYVDINADYRS